MKKILLIIFLSFTTYAFSQVTAEELVTIHTVTTTEMNAVTSPNIGSLIFNTIEKAIYYFDGTIWKRLVDDGSETKITAGTNVTNVTGNGKTGTEYKVNISKPTLTNNNNNTYTFSNGIDANVIIDLN